jgi:DNA replication and repair protein RecF
LQVAELGAELVTTRREVIELLSPAYDEHAAELGLERAELRYDGEPPAVADLEARLARDLERAATGLGPHLHDVAMLAEGRDLRTFGSQGEQRTAVLALLLAEASLLAGRDGDAPLLLLDDALSELDADRRRRLSRRLGVAGQTVVTATGAEALPLAPAQLVTVTPGHARSA